MYIQNPFSYKIENKVSNFRVGKGKDINITREIKEYNAELEFKGKTYQNLTSRGMSFKSQNFEGIFVQENEPNSLLVTRISDNNQGWLYAYNAGLKRALIKPNTKYTLIFKLDANKEIVMPVSLRDGNSANPITDQVNAVNVCSNIYVATLTTVSDFAGLGGHQVIYFHGNYPRVTGDWCRYYHDVIFLEGDYSNTPIEEFPKYFEGIKSSFEEGIVDVEVQGKNLFDKDSKDIRKGVALGQHDGTYNEPNMFTSGLIRVEPNCRYAFMNVAWGWVLDENGKKVADCNTKDVLKIPNNCHYIRISGSLTDLDSIQIEKASKSTSYEPYYKKKILFNIGESLRSLPNGVCDEIRNNNGQWELIRRVEKVVIDGTDYVAQDHPPSQNSTIAFAVKQGTHSNIDNAPILNDKFINVLGDKYWNEDKECLMSASGKHFKFRILRSKLETEDSAGFKKWLSQNPTTVYYEKDAPEIIPIEPIKAYIKTGATITINSEIVPTSYHKITLNRGEQIEQAIVEIAVLKAKIDTLETAYNSYLLETQHKLSLLGFEYQLESEEI